MRLLLSLSLSLKDEMYLSSYGGLKLVCQPLGAVAVRLNRASLSILFFTSNENSNLASLGPLSTGYEVVSSISPFSFSFSVRVIERVEDGLSFPSSL
ncbi:hypothetical protein ES703_101574 [subsurface metagenome]